MLEVLGFMAGSCVIVLLFFFGHAVIEKYQYSSCCGCKCGKKKK